MIAISWLVITHKVGIDNSGQRTYYVKWVLRDLRTKRPYTFFIPWVKSLLLLVTPLHASQLFITMSYLRSLIASSEAVSLSQIVEPK